ncbi:hypothetical protein K3727_09635 [Rhodobacteraceae bacterium M382]|nr:hypothetical protein K3727_09635 [Rhodobacteraceae bacterium M382]
MELHTFCFSDLHRHGDVFWDYLALRKHHFVDQLGWHLSHDGRLEMDQYDHPLAVYSVVTHAGYAIAGARALPCNAMWGGWSYMLRDAHLGKLDFIPAGLMNVCPETEETWECTRLVLQDEIPSLQRALVLKLIVFGLCREVSTRGGTSTISLSPVALGRLLRTIGYDAFPSGEKYKGVEDRRLYRPFQMLCDPGVNEAECSQYLSPLSGHGGQEDLLARLTMAAA